MAEAKRNMTWEEAIIEQEKEGLPESVQQGTKEATFNELKQAIMEHCETFCETKNLSVLECPCWNYCPLYPYREGATAVDVVVGHA